jgi:hypothetical protein
VAPELGPYPEWIRKACIPALLDPAVLPPAEWAGGLLKSSSRIDLDVQAGYELAREFGLIVPIFRRARDLQAEQLRMVRNAGGTLGPLRNRASRFADPYLDAASRNRPTSAPCRPWLDLPVPDRQRLLNTHRRLFSSPAMERPQAVQLLASGGDATHGTGSFAQVWLRFGHVPAESGMEILLRVDPTKPIAQLKDEFALHMAALRKVRGIRQRERRGQYARPAVLLNALAWQRIHKSGVLPPMDRKDFCRQMAKLDRRYRRVFTDKTWRLRKSVAAREVKSRFGPVLAELLAARPSE